MKRKLHPKIIDLLSNGSAFSSLAKAIHPTKKLTLIVGAGVSASASLPPWIVLLRRIAATYLTHWEFEKGSGKATNSKPPRDLSIAFWNEYHWSDQTKNFANELVAQEDALRLAQMVKARIREKDWLYLVRKSLYGDRMPSAKSALLMAIASICANRTANTEILSYNYDNLIEMALSESGISADCIWEPKTLRKSKDIPIYFPHGYLRYDGGPKVSIVLGEDDYSQYAINQYSWKNSIQLRQFSSSTCLFIGFSLTDPQVRRLLWVAKGSGGGHHYALLPSPSDKDEKTEMLEALFDAQLRDINVHAIRYCSGGDGRDHSKLPELIALLQDFADDPKQLWV